MINVLEDFEVNSYILNKEIYLNNLCNKSKDKNFSFDEKLENYLLTVFIEELDKKDTIFFTKRQIKSMYCDIKNGIFVFKGVINEKDTSQLKLIKNSLKNRTFNPFIKNVTITKAVVKDLEKVNVLREFKFKGYIADFYEYYDNFGNFNFEFVVCRRKVLYRDDIFIKRMINGILLIGKVQEPAKITIPIAKDKKDYEHKKKKGKLKNLQVGNTFWAIGGICLAGLGVAGTIATGGMAAIVITVLFGANTIASNSYSIYLDYNDRDDEMDLDTFYNNPLKFSMGEFLVRTTNEENREIGHVVYHGAEIFLGVKGLQGFAKGFKVKSLFKFRDISVSHPILGKLQGRERVLIFEKVLFNGYQIVDGVKGVENNIQGANKAIKEYELSTYKPTLKLKEAEI